MPNSQESNTKQKQVRQESKAKTSGKEAVQAQRQPVKMANKRSTSAGKPMSPLQEFVLTPEEFRARVARTAFELYEKRRAVTEVEDWLEAERLVKTQLLSDGHEAGSV